MKFIDFFAGIGGFRLGLERAGHECVGACEISNFPRKILRGVKRSPRPCACHTAIGMSWPRSPSKKIGARIARCPGPESTPP